MDKTTDITGRDIQIGDYIAYTTRQSSSMTTHIAKVLDIFMTAPFNDWKIKIASLDDFAWHWVGDNFERYEKVYKATLTSNATIVILSHVPDKYRIALKDIT